METIKINQEGNKLIVRNGLVVIHRKEKVGDLIRIKNGNYNLLPDSKTFEDEAMNMPSLNNVPPKPQIPATSTLLNKDKKHKKKNKKERIAAKKGKKEKKLRKKTVERNTDMFDISDRKNNAGKLLANILINSKEIRVVKGRTYVYQKKRGIFVEKDKEGIETLLNTWVDKNINENIKFNSRDNAEAYKMLLTTASIQREELSNSFNTPFVPCENGVLDTGTMKLLPHSPEFEFTWAIKARYDENSVGTLFSEYLDIVTQGDEEKQLFLQEIAGYSLSSFTFLRTAFIFIGGRGTGKSTILDLLATLADEAGVCNIPFKKMENEYFVADILASKLNIAPDAPGDVIKEISRFNSLVSDSDRVTGRSPYEKPETKRCRTKMLFGTNHHFKFNGPTKEDIEAFFDRIQYVTFNKYIEKRIHGFGEILFRENADFVFTWAMQGLHRLIKNNFVFTKCKSSEKAKAEAMAQYCPEEIFFSQCIKIVDEDIYESSEDIRQAFNAYCLEHNVSGIYNIKSYLDKRGVQHYRKRIDDDGKICPSGNPKSVYAGIRLKNKYRV